MVFIYFSFFIMPYICERELVITRNISSHYYIIIMYVNFLMLYERILFYVNYVLVSVL